jgi:hypothetical protein
MFLFGLQKTATFPSILLKDWFLQPRQSVYCAVQTERSNTVHTTMLVPGDPGRLGTPIYVFTVGSPQPVWARYASCTQLLWKPHDPSSRDDTPIYTVTFETSRLVGARNTSCKQVLWKPRDHSRESTYIYLVTFETSRPVVSRTTSRTRLLWKTRDPSREGAPIYLVTFETSRPMGQCTVHVSSYSGNTAIRAGKAHPFT